MNFNEILLCADRISGYIQIENPEEWENIFYSKNALEFPRHFGPVTGEEIYNECKTGGKKTEWTNNYKYWKIKRTIYVDSFGQERFYLYIDGCPPKLKDKGQNLRTLTAFEFTNELNDLADYICLPIEAIRIRPSEVSETIYPGFSFDIKNRAIAYQNKEFKAHYKDNTGIFMGVHCNNAHYETHLYFVNVKYDDMDQVAIRLERKYNRSQTFKRDTGINTWADLISEPGINSLAEAIEATWNDIIIFDPALSPSRLFNADINEAIKNGNSAVFWKQRFETLGTKKYKKLVNNYRAISTAYGDGLHQKVYEMLSQKNKALITNKALTESEDKQKMENCYILLNGNNMPKATNDHREKDYLLSNNKEKRLCKCCGRDISEQRAGSIYCSAKYVGKEAAKRCRNTINNLRHRTKGGKLINQPPINRLQLLWNKMKDKIDLKQSHMATEKKERRKSRVKKVVTELNNEKEKIAQDEAQRLRKVLLQFIKNEELSSNNLKVE